MGTRADEIRHDIAQRRDDLGETLDAIGDKVSPKRMVQRRTDGVKRGWSRLKVNVMGSVEDTSGSARERMQGWSDQASQTAGQAREKLGDAADTVSNSPQYVADQTRGNPIAAGLIAFGAGALLASVIPASEPEARAASRVQEKAHPLGEALKDDTTQAAHELQSSAQEKAQGVRETVTQAASDLNESAAEHAQDIKGQAKEEVQEKKDQLKETAQEKKEQLEDSASPPQPTPTTR